MTAIDRILQTYREAAVTEREKGTYEMYLRADPTETLALLKAHHAPLIQRGTFREPSDKLMQSLAVAAQRP